MALQRGEALLLNGLGAKMSELVTCSCPWAAAAWCEGDPCKVAVLRHHHLRAPAHPPAAATTAAEKITKQFVARWRETSLSGADEALSQKYVIQEKKWLDYPRPLPIHVAAGLSSAVFQCNIFVHAWVQYFHWVVESRHRFAPLLCNLFGIANFKVWSL